MEWSRPMAHRAERLALLRPAGPRPPEDHRRSVARAAALAAAAAATLAGACAAAWQCRGGRGEAVRLGGRSPADLGAAVQELAALPGACRDTPGWTDGWARCAYEGGGTDGAICKPLPGALWPSVEGWTCAAYEQKGWCSAGRVQRWEEGRNRPEENCCACGGGSVSGPPDAAASCNKDTGGKCGFFGACDDSRGPTECIGGKCMCHGGLCADVAGACAAPPPSSSAQMASQAVEAALGLEVAGEGELCQSSPGWTDGWIHCAYEDGGKSEKLCATVGGASWPAARGWTCEAYREKGWCKGGRPANATMGAGRSFPERHCCECGGGKVIASVESIAAAPPQLCQTDTGGTCRILGCDSFRGPAHCSSKKCICQEGYCADSAGTCQPRPSTTAPPADLAVRHALGLKLLAGGAVCQDTAGWADGFTLCAYQDGGRQSSLCRPTPGAFWPSTQGWTCQAYEERGWCRANGSHSGVAKNFPEQHCCVCGGGEVIAKGDAKAVAAAPASACYAYTGGTCRITGSCHDFRGPAECVDGRCVCPSGFCADASGACRRSVGTVVAEVAPVSRQRPQFPGGQGRVKTALCISGGGSRSLSAALGQLRALHRLGLLDRVDLLSAVSGGSWAASVLMFADVPLERLLGGPSEPSALTLAALDAALAPLGEAATKSTNRVMMELISSGVPTQMLWVSTIAEVVLKPFGLDSLDAYMAGSAADVERIVSRNPQLKGRQFLTPKLKRPAVLVMSGTVEAPDGYEASAASVAPLQMSPDFSGTPFHTKDGTVSYEPTSGTDRPPLTGVLLGGGFVETFAFGGEEPAEGQSGGNSVQMQAPLTPLSLARAVGISSAAFGAFASKLAVAGVAAGARFDPQANLWPITSGRFPGAHPAMTYQLGDGSNLDNTGIIAALQRGASHIVALINADTPLDSGADLCAPGVDVAGRVTRQLAEKFGVDGAGGHFGFYGHNQVFDRAALQPLLCDFDRLRSAGKSLVLRRSLTLQRNDWWGLEGGRVAEVVFVLLAPHRGFEAALPAETREELAKEADGAFANFPNYRTVFQGSDLTALTRRQANLLAAQAEFSINEHASSFRDVLSRAS